MCNNLQQRKSVGRPCVGVRKGEVLSTMESCSQTSYREVERMFEILLYHNDLWKQNTIKLVNTHN